MFKKVLKALFGLDDIPILSPGEVEVMRNWTDDPLTDTTVITIGGQVDSKQLAGIKAILKGKATARTKPARRAPLLEKGEAA